MQRNSARDFWAAHVVFATGEEGRSRELKLEHREARVHKRYRRSYIGIAFVLASALSMLAQSHRMSDGDSPLLTASLEVPAIGGNESELPDAPSSAKPDAATVDPAPAPVVK